MRNLRVSEAATSTAWRKVIFCRGTHTHADQTPSSTRRPEDRSARPIEGQVANYVQLRSAGPMKIEREFANTVGGADPSGTQVGCPDIRIPIRTRGSRAGPFEPSTRKLVSGKGIKGRRGRRHQNLLLILNLCFLFFI